MQIAMLGSFGLGLVWGWLIGILCRPLPDRWLSTCLALGLATALIALETWLLVDWRAAVFFVAAASLALGAHLVWLYNLRRQSSTD